MEQTVTNAGEGSTKKTVKNSRPPKKTIKHKAFSYREFLNLPDKESDALVAIKIKENSILNTNKSKDTYDLKIRITSCHNEINLHNSLKKNDLANALHKIRTLEAALRKAGDFIESVQSEAILSS